MQVRHIQKIAHRGISLQHHYTSMFIFHCHTFVSSIRHFLRNPYCDSTYIISCTSFWGNILQSCGQFSCSTRISFFSILAVTFLNHVSIFLAVYTIFYLFYIRTINIFVALCTKIVARSLELIFNLVGFFIYSWVVCVRLYSHLIIFIRELVTNTLDSSRIFFVIRLFV